MSEDATRPGGMCTATTLCSALSKRLDLTGRKGFEICEWFHFDTGETSAIGVRYKTKPTDPGLMLNLCPWCGGKPLHDRKLS